MAELFSEGLDSILNNVQGHTLEKNVCGDIVKILDYDNDAKPQTIETLLKICIQDPKDDVEYAREALNIVSILLKKVIAGEFTSRPDLLPSMLEILHMINSSIYSSTSDEIKVMFFKTLISYPDELYLKLEEDNEILELFNLYVHQRIPIELRVQPIYVLHKYLKVLPPEKRLQFVEDGINIWFLKLIPNVMLFATISDFDIEIPLNTLEIVVNEFVHIDYYDNPNFQCILQCFYEPQKYPTIMKNLLQKGSNIWHRLWIVFIKVFKNLLTKSGSSGSPINSMLPVVESAFKLDINNRCLAFKCWNALIDNFATETNEAYIHKRIKLLIIPLYSNNAKVEDTVIAKIDTWWHLTRSYYSKLSNFSEIILIPFLHFCFGKPIDSKPSLILGHITDKTKKYCVEVLVNILGHHNCDGCLSMPALKYQIIDETCLLECSKELVHCMNSAVKIVANSASKLRQPYKCAWKSLLNLICDVNNHSERRNLFNELLIMLENVIQVEPDEILGDIVLNDMILTLFEDNDKIMLLLNPIDEQDHPIHKILLLILNPSLESVYKRNEMSKAAGNLKPISDFITKHCFHDSPIETFLNQQSSKYNFLVFWSAVMLSLSENKFVTSPEILHKMLLRPLKHVDILTKVDFCTSLWFELLLMHITLDSSSLKEDIFEIFNNSKKFTSTNSLFFLNIAITLLTQKMTADTGVQYENEMKLVHDILNKIQSLNCTHPLFLKLIDAILKLFKNLLKYTNMDIAKQVLMILKLVFNILQTEFKKSKEVDAVLLAKIEQMFKSVEDLLNLESYAPLKQTIMTEFLEYAQCFGEQQSLKNTILGLLQMFLKTIEASNPFVNRINDIMTSINGVSRSAASVDKPKFTTPVSKKVKKNETNIVNTVVEDGEEFVVVKSNWKFNPKKLTDNQKEKLKRKREDIPALYQDLSQSQDDFKLNTWKTDSQETTTTTTSSKSNDLTTSEKVSSILKNMPNTDVVPKILKNILNENNEKQNPSDELSNKDTVKMQSPATKGTKPKLSLKDRVFRNVRILIEKSDVTNYDKNGMSFVSNDITPQLQTPTGKTITNSDSNSAPSAINVDRPSRVKRKPKKFEEMQIFALKKMRHSTSNSESQNKSLFEDLNDGENHKQSLEVEEIKSKPSGTMADNQENHDILAPNTDYEPNNTLSNNVSNMDQEKLVQHGNDVDENIKSNALAPTSDLDVKNNVVTEDMTSAEVGQSNINNNQLNTTEHSSIKTPPKKKTGKRKSRIEKELAIDMVEGHPYLKAQSEKRLTRKKVLESAISRRKTLTPKLNKSRRDQTNTPKVDKKIRSVDKLVDKSKELDTLPDAQESSFHDENGSQDIIESSQESTVSIMSVKSSKTVKRVPVVKLDDVQHKAVLDNTKQSESLIADSKIVNDSVIFNSNENDDTDFPLNKTVEEPIQIDLTADCDTQPVRDLSSIETIVNNDEKEPSTEVKVDSTDVDMDTQDIADADTQPIDPNAITVVTSETNTPNDETKSLDEDNFQKYSTDTTSIMDSSNIQSHEEITRSLNDSLLHLTDAKQDECSSKESPKDEEKRKQDFLNNTLEISPIKTLSPVRENKSPSPDNSTDYVVIKLSSPVQSNGEPFEKCDSPEIFTEEKVSPDKRDQSPPREEVRVNTTSPRSLSLKKNKPQVRCGGRAAQMLGLCIPSPDRIQNKLNPEKPVETDEPKKSSPLNSSARRNLRILYNSTSESETSNENEESNNFLKMKRSLPAADSSPSVPILKRKLGDIVDDTTVSPASKRKRVSFHDPPVSTTVCVKKYIEPNTVRSPQNSALKRQERRSQATGNFKSQKRLDTVFKLDTALTKAVESFSNGDVTPIATEDTDLSSLEPTPLVEVVKNCDLNDVDPICVDLINCKDPVDNIAGDLSSSAMRPLLVKEFAGKIETVGDLAKMTELEVNRLCIKAPKVQVAKKVLTEYAKKINSVANQTAPVTEAINEPINEPTVPESKTTDCEMQTDCVTIGNVEVQTESNTSSGSTQTNTLSMAHCTAQTDESGSKSSADIAKSLLEKPDFCDRLNELLDVPSKLSIAASLPINVLTERVVQDIGIDSTKEIIDRLLEKHSDSTNGRNDKSRLSFIQNYLSERFSSKDLILLCSDLLKNVYDNHV